MYSIKRYSVIQTRNFFITEVAYLEVCMQDNFLTQKNISVRIKGTAILNSAKQLRMYIKKTVALEKE